MELAVLQKRLAMTFVYVTHDQEEALVMSDRIARVVPGRRLDTVGRGRDVCRHGQFHRIPAPTVRAMLARSVSAQVKRARFAFTCSPSSAKGRRSQDRQPGGLG